MRGIERSVSLTLCTLALLAGSATALVHERGSDSPLQTKEFRAPELDVTPVNLRASDSLLASELHRLGADPSVAFLDARGGRWRTLLFARPTLPGSGAGNDLSWNGDRPADDAALGELAWQRIRAFVTSHADSLRIDVDELDPRVAVHNGGALIQIWADRTAHGLPVRGAGFTAVINHGNLVLMGIELWGDVALDPTPVISAKTALAQVESFVAPMEVESLQEQSSLTILPVSAGEGYSHRLAWTVRPTIPGDLGQWEMLVDAHSGELLAFQDLNHYGSDRTITGGVYPVAYDGIAPDGSMVDDYPMPFADVSSGGFTDAGGNFSAVGSVTTTLNGEYIRISEFCAAINESSTGDIDLEGTDGDTDCDTPAGHSGGDTAAARSGFYELNRINAMGRAQLPANGWLAGQLTAEMNISQTCNAFWTGSTVQFFRETPPCANTGQLAGVFDHEWGHGMDDNDVNGSIPGSSQGGGEGMADIYAALRLNQSCVGRGFFLDGSLCSGYGDPCTMASGCTGIRSVDFADRTSGTPHTLTWVRANCGTTVHCLGAAYSETVWDILKRDLPALHGMDNNTALEVTTRLTFIGAGNASGWFDRVGGGPGAAGCGATQAYLQYLAADDDNGMIGDGTPHMDAIASAFDRHEIGCTPANGGPTVTVSGCAGTPTTAPIVSATTTNQGADLSWAPVAGASSYNIYRTDGEHECDFGKELVGSTAGTTFSDSGLLNDRGYFYVVTPMGPHATCFGPASNCATAGLFGFQLVATPSTLDVCAPTDPDPTVDVDVISIGGWSFNVNLAASGEPPSTTSTFVPNDQVPDFTSTYTLLGTDGSTSGSYTIDINGTGSDVPSTLSATSVVLNLAVANPGAPTLTSPADGAIDQDLMPTLTWTAGSDATSYDLEIADDMAFGNIVYTATGLTGLMHTVETELDPSTTYYWRVTSVNGCGTITSGSFSFTTVILTCQTFDSTDVPLPIPEGGGTSGTTTSTLTVGAADGGTIADVNVLNLIGTHTYMGDLDFFLDSPATPQIQLREQACGTDENFNINYDDEAAPGSPPCPPTNAGTYQPLDPLSAFDGSNSTGTWTLSIVDNFEVDAGQLQSWSLEICVESAVQIPVFLDGFESGDTSMWDITVP